MSWQTSPLSELLDVLESGSRPKGGVRGIESGVPSVGGEHLDSRGGFDFTSVKYVPHGFAEKMRRGRIKHGDVLVVKDGATTGKTSFAGENFPYQNAFVNEHVFICRPNHRVEPKYLFWYLFSDAGQKRILENFKGSAQGGINQEFAPNTLVPVAPMEKQRRIVAKLDKLTARIDEAKARLDTIPTTLKRFRQSILAAACSGRLTADWRISNSQATGDIADVEVGSDLPDLPSSWRYERLGNLLQGLKYGTSQKCDYEKRGKPVFRIPNIGDGVLLNDNLKYAELPEREYQQLALQAGDILLIRSNGSVSLVGKTALVSAEFAGYAYAGYLIRLRPNEKVRSDYLNHVLASMWLRQQIEIPARSTSGVNNINSEEVKNLLIPLPPIDEQAEIVRRVEALFKQADAIEARYKKARAFVEKLTPSVLAKAFRGELV